MPRFQSTSAIRPLTFGFRFPHTTRRMPIRDLARTQLVPRAAARLPGGGGLPGHGNRVMTDSMSQPARSRNMQRITAKNTKPEMAVRKYLHSQGFRYSLHRHALPGRPDIVLPKYRTVVQVQGCFWHQHPDPECRDAHLPKSNHGYWVPKLQRTVVRDRKNRGELARLGWTVEIVWACQTNDSSLAALTNRIRSRLPSATNTERV